MRGLEALNELKKQNDFLKKKGTPLEYRYDNELIIIEKELKALEIIKNKLVLVPCLMAVKSFERYNEPLREECKLNREEYDLLKEVLTSDKTTIN